MKPKIFIGSSVEGLKIANAIQAQLDYTCETTVWKDGIFMLSKSTLESLEKVLDDMDYGIFVFSPDDIMEIRNENVNSIRDNVLFEFGLFMGKFGRDKVFFITPQDSNNLHLPTDLLGINRGIYFEREDGNMRAAVNTFCEDVKEAIMSFEEKDCGLIKYGMFQEFAREISKVLAHSKYVDLFFIHSRGWRENNHNAIIKFLDRQDSQKLTVFLPDFLNEALMNDFETNFSDGRFIPSLIEDAVTFFVGLKNKYNTKVEIFLYNFFPTYSFYMFDKCTVIALYPTTDKKKNVPTMMVNNGTEYYNFVADDREVLKKNAICLTEEHLLKLKEK